MTFQNAHQVASPGTLSSSERKSISILLIEPSLNVRSSTKQTLATLGFANVYEASDHASGLEKLGERSVTHVIFDAKKTNMPAKEFLAKALQMSQSLVAIPCSQDPSVDDVFNLLIAGARGYIVKPFTADSLDEAVVQATKGQPISDSILHAKDRNEALASLILTALDRAATVMRQAQKFETARVELPAKIRATRKASEIGQLFALGGPETLMQSIIEFCIERGDGPASKLGRLRRRLGERHPDPGDKDKGEAK